MTSSEEDAQVGGLGVGDDRLHAVVRLRPLEVLFRGLGFHFFYDAISPSDKTVSQELCPVMAGAATSQRTAAVPAKAPGAARLSHSAGRGRGFRSWWSPPARCGASAAP